MTFRNQGHSEWHPRASQHASAFVGAEPQGNRMVKKTGCVFEKVHATFFAEMQQPIHLYRLLRLHNCSPHKTWECEPRVNDLTSYP